MPQEYTVVEVTPNGETLISIRPEKGYSVERFTDALQRGRNVELRKLYREPYTDPLNPSTWTNRGEVIRTS